MLHGDVWPPRGWLLQNVRMVIFFFKKSKKVEIIKIVYIFIDVKPDFLRLAHHFDTFFIFIFKTVFPYCSILQKKKKIEICKKIAKSQKKILQKNPRNRIKMHLKKYNKKPHAKSHRTAFSFRRCRIDVTKT